MASVKTFEFKDCRTESVSQTLLIGLAGPSGSGKTESAIRIARGIAGDNIAIIDTENRRALNKKKRYTFKHLDMGPPYTPGAFRGAVAAAIEQGFKAAVVDSFSAEWDGEGGLHDQATEALEKMSRGDAAKAEAMLGLAWKQPKLDHKQLMIYLRRVEIPIIFCLRAEPKIKYIKEYDEKKGREVTKVVDAGWLPIADKLFAYDMLIYALMMPDNPGVPVHLKKLEPEFEPMFPPGKQITEECGRMLAQWAAGETKPAAPLPPYDDAKFEKNMPVWKERILAGKNTPDEIIQAISRNATLSDAQKQKIRDADKHGLPYAEVAEALRLAKTDDMRAAAADLIRHVQDEGHRKELEAIWHKLDEMG